MSKSVLISIRPKWYALIAKMEEKAKLIGKESPVVLADEETGQRAAEGVGPYDVDGGEV